MRVFPEHYLFEDPPQLQVSELNPSQKVTLRTQLTDKAGELFTSLGWYRAKRRAEPFVGGLVASLEWKGPLCALAAKHGLKRLIENDM